MRKLGIGIAATFTWSQVAFAQTAPSPGAGAANPGAATTPSGSGNAASGTPAAAPLYPNNPAPSTGPIGGGNAEYSSSRPVSGAGKDGFDLGPNRQGSSSGKTQYGGENGAMFLSGSKLSGSPQAALHTVRRGDTLWDICDFHFQNPYQWPKIWSYNAQIQNPHWIYPGDVVNLKQGQSAANAAGVPASSGSSLVDKRRQVSPNTIFLRTEGFIQDDTDVVWGELNGSREDKTFLSDFDEVYMRILGDRTVRVGEELTIFRPVRKMPEGQIVEIQGTVRVDQWNPREKIARGRITETTDTIERGARVGPIQRRLEVVAPVRNEKDLQTHVIASLSPHSLYGQHQVIFVSAGKREGLVPGNRLFVVNHGDGYQSSLPSRSAAVRIAMESEAPAEIQPIPNPGNPWALPEEVVAELRVISVRENSAVCVVVNARREVEPGDPAVTRKGY
jgi:hypothetical protein